MTTPSEELKTSRDNLLSLFDKGEPTLNFQENYTEIMDQYFRRSFQESPVAHDLFRDKRPFAIVPVGGYGRKELCIHSDIDIILLFNSEMPSCAKSLAEDIFYPLWDLRLDLGYGIRTIRDCLNLCRDEFGVLTSMMDARFICGDSPLFLSFMESLQKRVVHKKKTSFVRWIEDIEKIRSATAGDASRLLEPDLKEGIGGLRDYHHILWLARVFLDTKMPRDLEYMGILSHREYQELTEHRAFISLVRNHLHRMSGRKNDRLNFEYQEKIARNLGFRDEKPFMATEKFMGRLHSTMAYVKSLHHAFISEHIPRGRKPKKTFRESEISEGIHIHLGKLHFHSAANIVRKPVLLMNIFEQSARSGLALSLEARRLVREFLYLVDEDYRMSRNTVEKFLHMMGAPHTFPALEQMLETGFLGTFIPEFEQIKDRVQFDTYHIFPVGSHVLQTVNQLKNLSQEKDLLLLDIFSDLTCPETLFLAGLFHDIGKNGKNHSRQGVKITDRILKRFGYDRHLADDILFLIGRHLLLAETATRRDLNDEKVVVQCARTIGTVDRLKMLYLLTWADSRATGPRAWNEWIANLVQELFFKILHLLEKGDLATQDASRKVKNTLSRLRRNLTGKMDTRQMEALFEVMSTRYLLETEVRDIESHVESYQRFHEMPSNRGMTAFHLEAYKEETEGYWGVTFLARDRPGLFSDIAGVMALHNINILSAHIYTWRDGTALDLFKVTSPLDKIHAEETWEKLRTDLKNIFWGKLSLDYRLAQKAKSSILSIRKDPSYPPHIHVDNDSSDFFTIIEVFASDRIGLLYIITHTLFSLRLDIRIAKIATRADQIADVFYVRDLEGQKVIDPEQVVEIKQALVHTLEPKDAKM